MISWTITVPPTVGTAYATGSQNGETIAEPNTEGSEADATVSEGASAEAAAGMQSTSSNGNVIITGSSSSSGFNAISIAGSLEVSGSGSFSTTNAFTASWNGEQFPATYEASGYTSGTRTSIKETSATTNITWQDHEQATTASTTVSGTTRTTTSETETLTVATTTSVATTNTVTSSSVGSTTRNTTKTDTDTVTAYGSTFSVTTTTNHSTTSRTSISRPPTNTGFRHTATVVSLEGNEILWVPTTSGRGVLSDFCESYDAGVHTINRLTTAVSAQEVGTSGDYALEYETQTESVTQSTLVTESKTVVGSFAMGFPGSTRTTIIEKLSSTTSETTKTLTNVALLPVETTIVYSTRSTQFNIDGIQVPTTALTTSEVEFTFTVGTTYNAGNNAGGTSIQPWLWAKLFSGPYVESAKAVESKYLHGRGAPAGSVVGSQAKAGALSFTAPTTALNNQTVVAAYPTSWTQSEETKTSTISVNGAGVTISTENSTTSGSSSNEWEIEGQATHEALVSERISPAGRAPKGNITAFYGPGLFYTTANGSTGTVSVANFTSSQVDSAAAGRTAYSPAPLYEIGYLTYDGGSYFVTTTRYDSNILAESSISL